MNLSEHFSLEELTITQHREIDNSPTPEIVVRLSVLATSFLEPIRAKWGRLMVTSGYRSPALNAAIGGSSKTSAHMLGCAADLIPLDKPPDVDLETHIASMVLWLRDQSGLQFDQAISEINAVGHRWLHVGIAVAHPPRRQCLTMHPDPTTGEPIYSPF